MNYVYNDGSGYLKIVKLVKQYEYTALVVLDGVKKLLPNHLLMREKTMEEQAEDALLVLEGVKEEENG